MGEVVSERSEGFGGNAWADEGQNGQGKERKDKNGGGKVSETSLARGETNQRKGAVDLKDWIIAAEKKNPRSKFEEAKR